MMFRRMWFQSLILAVFIVSNLFGAEAFTVGAFRKIYDPSVGETGPWYINDHIDWEGVAEEIKADYSEVDYDGEAYFIRC